MGLPPAVTAATGVDAMTHSLESLLSANPNPFAEAVAVGVIRTVERWLRRAVADGSDLEARSQMLMASHLAGVGQASGTGVGLIHALGHAIGTRGRVAHGTALATVIPDVLRFYLGTRDHELALIGDRDRRRAPRPRSEVTAAGATIAAIDKLLRDVGQRPTLRSLGLADDASIDLIVGDALADAAIRNSPRLPTADEARAILVSVAGLTVSTPPARSRVVDRDALEGRGRLLGEPLAASGSTVGGASRRRSRTSPSADEWDTVVPDLAPGSASR